MRLQNFFDPIVVLELTLNILSIITRILIVLIVNTRTLWIVHNPSQLTDYIAGLFQIALVFNNLPWRPCMFYLFVGT